MKIFAVIAASLVLALTIVQAVPVSEKRDIPDVDIPKVNVGKNGDIVKVKPTRITVAKKGQGLAHIDTKGVDVGKGKIARVGASKVFVAHKGHGLADVQQGRVTVGKNGSIVDLKKNRIQVAHKGKLIDAGEVRAKVLKGKK
ncbi:hypothetical protein BGZ83_011709 [Gryganskiella cystojenkinii]|nr:hypothetical protein BGZ83_011709 [Gryganskiella cystojenkinii]